jgi:hypothetical protein
MGTFGRLSGLFNHSGNPNNRKAGRVRCQYVTCSLGEVRDLSSTGLRVLCKKNPGIAAGQAICFKLNTLDGAELPVTAEVAWARKAGWLKHELGMRFLDVSPELRLALLQLCRASAYNETLGSGERKIG